jgi:hypothetical protein
LRNCQITDSGAQKLGYALGNIYSQNKKLLILNLSTNYIGDKGAIELANVCNLTFVSSVSTRDLSLIY